MTQEPNKDRIREAPEGEILVAEQYPPPGRPRSRAARLRALRARLLKASSGNPSVPNSKANRPAWVLRLACTAVDLGAVAIISSSVMSLFMGASLPSQDGAPLSAEQAIGDSISTLALVVLVPAYYLFWEWLIGRTPGKMVLGLKMVSTSGPISRSRMIWRGIFRFIPLLQLFLMLSWRRTTFLDLITGTRVQCPPRHPGKKQPRPSSPKLRGYDENLAQR